MTINIPDAVTTGLSSAEPEQRRQWLNWVRNRCHQGLPASLQPPMLKIFSEGPPWDNHFVHATVQCPTRWLLGPLLQMLQEGTNEQQLEIAQWLPSWADVLEGHDELPDVLRRLVLHEWPVIRLYAGLDLVWVCKANDGYAAAASAIVASDSRRDNLRHLVGELVVCEDEQLSLDLALEELGAEPVFLAPSEPREVQLRRQMALTLGLEGTDLDRAVALALGKPSGNSTDRE